MRAHPRVPDSKYVGLYVCTFAIGPCRFDSIVIDRHVAGHMNGKLLDGVGLELDAIGRVVSDPIGDVILVHRRGADQRPADKILVPKRAILLRSLAFTYSQ